MKILNGLMNGAVLQRTEQDIGEAIFYAEASGEPRVVGDVGSVLPLGDNRYLLTGFRTGGPYTITLADEESTIVLTDIYVGDVWMLAGQSNMAGAGYFKDVAGEYHPDPFVRSFRFNDEEWVTAHPKAHENYLSRRPYMNRFVPYIPNHYDSRGIGPGYYFALEMRNRTGVPQGLIPCALGGSCMAQWNPEETNEEGNLYTYAIDRLTRCGGRVRGIFWYQGCSETGPGADAIFVDNMKRMIDAFRRDTGNPNLPFVQVQINRYVNCAREGVVSWNRIRELQRTLSDHIPNLDTVSTAGYTLADGIHLDAISQKKLGISAAQSMYHLAFDPSGTSSRLAPKIADIFIAPCPQMYCHALAIRYENLDGPLTSDGIPFGFALSEDDCALYNQHIFRIELYRDTVYLYNEVPVEKLKEMNLSYFNGIAPFANITDGAERPLPAFGPLPLRDYLK